MDKFTSDERKLSVTIETILRVLNLEEGSLSADTVFHCLSRHLTHALRKKMGDRDQLYEVADAVEFYQFNHKTSGQTLLAVGRRSNNRLGGRIAEYPIAAYLVQEALFENFDKYVAWQALVTAVIFSNKSYSKELINRYGRICTELRRAAKKGERADILLSLPKLVLEGGVVYLKGQTRLKIKLPDPLIC